MYSGRNHNDKATLDLSISKTFLSVAGLNSCSERSTPLRWDWGVCYTISDTRNVATKATPFQEASKVKIIYHCNSGSNRQIKKEEREFQNHFYIVFIKILSIKMHKRQRFECGYLPLTVGLVDARKTSTLLEGLVIDVAHTRTPRLEQLEKSLLKGFEGLKAKSRKRNTQPKLNILLI